MKGEAFSFGYMFKGHDICKIRKLFTLPGYECKLAYLRTREVKYYNKTIEFGDTQNLVGIDFSQ